jgi:hypothetical protein
MQIKDLPYLTVLSEHQQVSGGALLEVGAIAFATGNDTYTYAEANTRVRTVGNGNVTIGQGNGTALAIGDDPYAHTDYRTEGFDKVIAKGNSRQGKRFASSGTRVIALALPR